MKMEITFTPVSYTHLDVYKRQVFIRIREEKQTYAQVAEELGISTKTVEMCIRDRYTRRGYDHVP